ncbi:MAG: hypothetical protein ACJ8EH_05280, partial [Sphingomicrobium sp.]
SMAIRQLSGALHRKAAADGDVRRDPVEVPNPLGCLGPFFYIFHIIIFIFFSRLRETAVYTVVLLGVTVVLGTNDGTTKLRNCSASRMIFHSKPEPIPA